MADSAEWIEAVRAVVEGVRETSATVLELEHGDFRIRLRRSPAAGLTRSQAEADSAALADPNQFRVLAPLTGVFYRGPSPSAKPYVAEGDWVDPETVIGLIETMKIFNEVVAEKSGQVSRFTAESGQLVTAGEALLGISLAERTAADAQGNL